MRNPARSAASLAFPLLVIAVACGGDKRSSFDEGGPDQTADPTESSSGGTIGGEPGAKPTACDEAAAAKSYVGCDYWPTVTPNIVQGVFDFAVAVANVGTEKANVTVTGPNGTNEQISVDPESLGVVYLPWVEALKGNESTGPTTSTIVKGGAFHLVSDQPVVVYQFNPLQFKAAGGPPNKDWSKCQRLNPLAEECYSYSNDASLLLPSTAMTGNYRVMGSTGFTRTSGGIFGGTTNMGTTLSITATADDTNVEVKLAGRASVAGGGLVPATNPGASVHLKLAKGDVAQLVAKGGVSFDFSGSVVAADKPVQVITGVPCQDIPQNVQACDHVEETLFPAETLGKKYVVMTPTGPKKNKVGQVVRIFGNEDNTKLTYVPAKPAGCPETLSAGESVDCGVVDTDFEVSGDKSFGVATFLLGGERSDPDYNPTGLAQPQGDPSQSFAVAVEQYRNKYVFLAPTDYKASYADVVAQTGASIKLDGQDVSSQLEPIEGTAYVRGRIALGPGKNGAHVLEGATPFGLQVIGYGDNTSYQYPGGLNLEAISAPPK